MRWCAVLAISSSLCLISCEDEEEPVVAITSFSPAAALAGAQVVISGHHFSTTTADNIVRFNGTQADVSAATSSSLTVIVPETATSGTISVAVGGHTATSTNAFTVLVVTLSGFEPQSGIAGTNVIITGENFNSTPANNVVKFNGVEAAVTAASATQITAQVPLNATTGKITVTSNGKTVTSATDFAVLQTTITQFSPPSATVGSTVVITGANFAPEAEANTVTFGGAEAEVTAASATELSVTVPVDAVTGKIAVTINGKTTESGDEFTVLEPVITSFAPQPASPGAEVTITGNYFSTVAEENNVVFIEDEIAEVISASATELVVRVPEFAYSGQVALTVRGRAALSGPDFQVASPAVAEVSPNIGAPSLPVRVIGSNFSPVPAYNKVNFDGIPAQVTEVVSTNEIEVLVPEGVTNGSVRVDIGNYSGLRAYAFTPCADSHELIFINADILEAGSDGSWFHVSFGIRSVGSLPADFADVKLRIFLSTSEEFAENVVTVEAALPLSSIGELGLGESYTAGHTVLLDGGVTTTSHPYMRLLLFADPIPARLECDIGNNIIQVNFE